MQLGSRIDYSSCQAFSQSSKISFISSWKNQVFKCPQSLNVSYSSWKKSNVSFNLPTFLRKPYRLNIGHASLWISNNVFYISTQCTIHSVAKGRGPWKKTKKVGIVAVFQNILIFFAFAKFCPHLVAIFFFFFPHSNICLFSNSSVSK